MRASNTRGNRRREPERTRVEVELELGADPIAGTIRDPAGSEASFHGWIELISALERASAISRVGESESEVQRRPRT